MQVLAAGSGKEHPKPNDCVRLRFVARTPDGTLFASSVSEGPPDIECIRRLTPGLAEAVKAMVLAETRRVWVPARLNSTPNDDEPPPASRAVDLTYELTLVELIKAPPTPSPLKQAPPGTRKLASGLALKIIQKGTGKLHPAASNRVTLHLSAWTTNGVLFESTRMSGHPAVYVVSELLPGVRAGVEELVAGDRARLWVPAELAYGNHPRRRGQPAGALVYDVEVLSIE